MTRSPLTPRTLSTTLSTLSALSFSLLPICLAGCSAGFAAGARAQSQGMVPAGSQEVADQVAEAQGGGGGAPAGAAYAAGEDRHWMQADDYFISEHPWTSNWIYVHLAKMKRAPGPDTKGQALFFQLSDSREVWTQHYWRTRPARPADLELGAMVLCFHGNMQSSVYRAPPTKDRARTALWFLGRITDVSDKFKRVVRVDTYSCGFDAVRALAPARAGGR